MDLNKAVRIIRQELLIKDEPLKAYLLLKKLDVPELAEEMKNTYGMIRHVFESESMEEHYNRPVPEAESIEPERVIDNPGARHARYGWIVEEIKRNKPKTYLDLGCYVGTLPIWAGVHGVKAYGVDMTKGSLDIARKRAKRRGASASFYQANVTKWKKHRVEMVTSLEVFEHIYEDRKYLEYLASLTTPSGWVYITTPDGPFGNGEGNLPNWEWDGNGMRGHLRAYNTTTLSEMLSEYEVDLLKPQPDGLIWIKYRKK